MRAIACSLQYRADLTVLIGDAAALVLMYNMIGSLPQPRTKQQAITLLKLRLKNNRSCLQYQTKAGYESCYATGFNTCHLHQREVWTLASLPLKGRASMAIVYNYA